MPQSIDRLALCLGCLWIKLKKIKPEIDCDSFKCVDAEGLGCEYPMVLVQIPMCNEREVYEASISAVCEIDWPKDRLLIQVLDDSDDEDIKLLIKAEVSKWSLQGVNIVYRHRLVRTGYKAGNLKSAMSCDYIKDCEFIALFDADFQPNPNFLKQTIPHFKGKPELGLVQALWVLVNKDENLACSVPLPSHVSPCIIYSSKSLRIIRCTISIVYIMLLKPSSWSKYHCILCVATSSGKRKWLSLR